MEKKTRWKMTLLGWIISILLSIIAGFITFYFTEKVKFAQGYEQGKSEGKKIGTKEARREAAAEFAKLLDESIKKGIQDRFPRQLEEARENGRLEGHKQGLLEGQKVGIKEGYDKGYNKGLKDAEIQYQRQSTFENFFRAFSKQIQELGKMTETRDFNKEKFKAQALTVYDVASHGRNALDTIAKSIDGLVDQLRWQVEKGHIDAAMITAHRLLKSLETNQIQMKKALDSLPRE